MNDIINGLTIGLAIVIEVFMILAWRYVGVKNKQGIEPAFFSLETMKSAHRIGAYLILGFTIIAGLGITYTLTTNKPTVVTSPPQPAIVYQAPPTINFPVIQVGHQSTTMPPSFDKELFKFCISQAKTKNGIDPDAIRECASAARGVPE